MNQLKALCKRLSLAFVVSLFTSAVCPAQTPSAGNPQSKTEKTAPAAPDKDKSATKTASPLDEELAKTPAGKTIAKFFAALNSGDIKQMRAFHESSGGNAENAEQDMNFFERTGGLRPHSVTASTKEEISVLVQPKKDERWLTLTFTVSAQEPYSITRISASPATAPAAQTSH